MDFDLMITSFPKLLSATVSNFKIIICFIIFWSIYWSFICNFKIK